MVVNIIERGRGGFMEDKYIKDRFLIEMTEEEEKKDILRNILIAIIVTVYFLFINLGVKSIPVTEYILDLKTFSIFAIIISIIRNIIASIIYVIGIWNGNENIIRKTGLINMYLWLIYSISTFAVAGAIQNIILIISTHIAIRNNREEVCKEK